MVDPNGDGSVLSMLKQEPIGAQLKLIDQRLAELREARAVMVARLNQLDGGIQALAGLRETLRNPTKPDEADDKE